MFLSQDRRLNIGLLCMRIGPAAGLLYHAGPRLLSGAISWEQTGKSLYFLKTGLPLKWIGLAVLLIEAAGALSLISGYVIRVLCFLLAGLFALHCYTYFLAGNKALLLYALGLFSVFLGLVFTGPGGYALTVKLKNS
ncbi:MAG: hypothetical protein ACOZF0_22730 [Thermodesulfobacteriota bacterium]